MSISNSIYRISLVLTLAIRYIARTVTAKNKLPDYEDDSFSALKLNHTLSKLMESNHISLTSLSRNTGIPLPTLKRLQTDSHANPTVANLLPLAKFFQISINQLLGLDPLPADSKGYIENTHAWAKVPIINWANIQAWPEVSNQHILGHVLTDAEVGHYPYALRVETNEWIGFMQGSLLIINFEMKPEDKDYVITLGKNQTQAKLKQYLVDEENIYLKPLNLNFKPTLVNSTIRFFGVLIQVRNNVRLPHE